MTNNITTNPRLEFFDSIAGQWDGWHDLEDLTRKLNAFLEKLGIDPSATVLDIGCGTGNLTVSLLNKTLGPSGRVVAVDISEKMLDLARRKVTDPRVAWFPSVFSLTPSSVDPFPISPACPASQPSEPADDGAEAP